MTRNGTMRNTCTIILSITYYFNLLNRSQLNVNAFEVPIKSTYNVKSGGISAVVTGKHVQSSRRSSSFMNSMSMPSHVSTTRNHHDNNRSRSRHNLSMHLGHSHSHHHHHTHDHSHSHSHSKQNQIKPTTIRGKILHQISKRGKAISIIFAAAATLLPVLLFKQRRINRTDVALFAVTSTVLSFTDKVRSETKYILHKVQGFRDGLRKHTPKTISATKYLFQNDNAADRVTFVGAAVNLLLSLGKGIIGITCHSSALVADAGHSLSDLFSDFITLWAVQIARLPPDDDVSLRCFGSFCILDFL